MHLGRRRSWLGFLIAAGIAFGGCKGSGASDPVGSASPPAFGRGVAPEAPPGLRMEVAPAVDLPDDDHAPAGPPPRPTVVTQDAAAIRAHVVLATRITDALMTELTAAGTACPKIALAIRKHLVERHADVAELTRFTALLTDAQMHDFEAQMAPQGPRWTPIVDNAMAHCADDAAVMRAFGDLAQ